MERSPLMEKRLRRRNVNEQKRLRRSSKEKINFEGFMVIWKIFKGVKAFKKSSRHSRSCDRFP